MVNSLLRFGFGLLLMGAAAGVQAEVVLGVPDAGVLRVTAAGGQATVRLAGLMLPPAGRAGAEAARRALAALVLGKDVTLQRLGRGYQGDVLARVSLRGRDIGAALVGQGYARVAAGSDPQLLRLQRDARRDGRGLWAMAQDTQRGTGRGRPGYGLIKVIIN